MSGRRMIWGGLFIALVTASCSFGPQKGYTVIEASKSKLGFPQDALWISLSGRPDSLEILRIFEEVTAEQSSQSYKETRFFRQFDPNSIDPQRYVTLRPTPARLLWKWEGLSPEKLARMKAIIEERIENAEEYWLFESVPGADYFYLITQSVEEQKFYTLGSLEYIEEFDVTFQARDTGFQFWDTFRTAYASTSSGRQWRVNEQGQLQFVSNGKPGIAMSPISLDDL